MITFADALRGATRTLLVAATLTTVVVGQGQGQDEEQARRWLQSGRSFLQGKNYKEALSDFESVLGKYPKTSVADDALLEIAYYQFEQLQDLRAAEATADRLLNEYKDSDSAPLAQVLKGRASLATGYTPEQVGKAIANFERVSRVYAGTDAVPEALFWAGEAARLGGMREDAIKRFSDLTTRYPASPILARALLGSASSLVAIGQPQRAIEQLQRVRNQFPTSPEASTALEWLTILYRLYVKIPAQPAYAYASAVGGPTGKIKDFRDLDVAPGNHLLVATKTGVVELGAKGEVVKTTEAPDALAMFLDQQGRPVTIHEEGGLRAAGRPPVVLATARNDGKVEPIDINAAVTMSNGDFIVANRDQKTLVRFAADGRPKGEFVRAVVARRLAIADLDDLAALDPDQKTITLISREGKIVGRIAERGTGYQLRQPMDLAFDRLGHLYVLDKGSIYVFTHQGSKLLTTFTIAEKSPGAFGNGEAMALDAAARLYVFDARTDAVQVYR